MASPVVSIVPATADHARALAPRVRAAEAAEVQAAAGHTPLEAILDALAQSDLAFTALFDGEVACMWGATPIRRSAVAGRIGAAWLLTSDLVERHPKTFWRGCKAELAYLFGSYDVLVNAIDARYDKSIRWAARLGAELDAPEPYGAEGRPFRWMKLKKGDAAWAPTVH